MHVPSLLVYLALYLDFAAAVAAPTSTHPSWIRQHVALAKIVHPDYGVCILLPAGV